MTHQASRKHAKNSFRDILRRVFDANAALLASKSFTAARLSRIAEEHSREACRRVRAMAVSQLIRIGGASSSRALTPPHGTVWLEMVAGGRITMSLGALAADARRLLEDRRDFNGRDAA